MVNRSGIKRDRSGYHKFYACLPILALAGWLQGCSKKPTEDISEGKDTLLRGRQEKDLAFKSGPDSPLPAEDKARFKGLDYYAPDPGLRFRVKLNRHPVPQSIRLGTNTGEIRTGLRYGYFEFQVEGQTCRLQVYRLDDMSASGEAYLFIPFRDATSGSETYAAGRYIDLRENTSGFYDLDFNRSYNPSCAYNKNYSCPLPPEENRLRVPIRAGEKQYALAADR